MMLLLKYKNKSWIHGHVSVYVHGEAAHEIRFSYNTIIDISYSQIPLFPPGLMVGIVALHSQTPFSPPGLMVG